MNTEKCWIFSKPGKTELFSNQVVGSGEGKGLAGWFILGVVLTQILTGIANYMEGMEKAITGKQKRDFVYPAHLFSVQGFTPFNSKYAWHIINIQSIVDN